MGDQHPGDGAGDGGLEILGEAAATKPTRSPCASVTMWRLRPLIFLPASKPRGPPFPVVFTDWLSMTPTVELASRPAFSRASMTRAWLMLAKTPLRDQA